jgi:hypothetical protein
MVPLGTVVNIFKTHKSSIWATDLNTLTEKFGELGFTVGI